MRLPTLSGLIKRRLLVNYRADPEFVQRLLPKRMRPKVVEDVAMVGICLIRLEGIRPRKMPFLPPVSSENAAHRMAVMVEQEDAEEEAVYIPRRDTDSVINHMVGGRLFPGEHHLADFSVRDQDGEIEFAMKARDGGVEVRVRATETAEFPASSRFGDLAAASAFFETGSRGYSDNKRKSCYDCMDLAVRDWRVSALDVSEVSSSYFEDTARFPPGTIEFDHALLMRDIKHEWHSAPALTLHS
ncbi:MAG: DUF2071 domain-containing protein [Roseibacillus sp.]|jgi:hypothetical protein